MTIILAITELKPENDDDDDVVLVFPVIIVFI